MKDLCFRFAMTGLALLGAVCADADRAIAADSSYRFTTFAGVAGTLISSADGTGQDAKFSAPRGVAVDSAGDVYVADSSNHSIRKITSAGVVTTLAGTAGSSGNRGGSGTAALFNEPFGVAVDSGGNVFVADTNNNAIRKITPTGVVTTLAGGSGSGTVDGSGTAAKFHEPRAIAIDSSGTLYVADYENHMVRKVTSAGVVTTLAGGTDISGYVDGQGTDARFMSLQGIAVDSAGNVYVTEGGNRDVRKISPTGLVTTLTSGTGTFGEPRGIAVDASGNLYIGDYSANVIRKVTSGGTVTTHAGTAPTAGSTDGAISSALFYGPSGVAIDSTNNIYVADTLNNTVRKISSAGAVTTFAGLAGRTSSVGGSATTARFEDPYAIAADGSGNLYVADATDHSIRKITSNGTVTTFAGTGGSFGSVDGTGSAARFKGPLGIAADSAGNVYVADTGNATVRKITAAGVVSTLAGSAGQSASNDGTGTAARFMSPYGITVDSSGTLYVVESTATVRKITAAGVVTTLAGSAGTNGYIDATGTAARFSVPFDIAVDGSGNLYVSDHGNHVVRKITAAGVVTTLAGSGSPGKTDATGSAASFKFPSGIAADSAGNVYLADTDNQVIRKITAAGVVTTIAGTGALGSADGTGTAASFYNPKDVAVDASGNLYVVDRGNHTIRKGSLGSSQTISFGTTPTVSLTTTGNVSATASSGLSVTLSSMTPSVCSISGTTVTALTAGTCTIAANQAGDANYAAATQATQSITVQDAAATTTPPDVAQSYKLTVTTSGSGYGDVASSPSGISCYAPVPGVNYFVAPDCVESYAGGTSVTLTATPTSGSTFSGWSGACTGSSSSCVVGMTEAKSVAVSFTNTGSTSDCIFNWAESTYPDYFPAGAPSATAAPYYYRYYSATATYLATSSADNHLWALGPVTGNIPVDVGPMSTFMTLAGCSSAISEPGAVALAEIGRQTVGGATFGSSSKLAVTWTAPSGYTADHYEITATEALMNTSVTLTAAASASSATLTPLKAATSYAVVVKACRDSGCASGGSAAAVSATTPGEYWQLQGSGNSVSTLTKPVSDGNARLSATRFGAEAGSTANTVQFYYGPMGVTGQAVASSGVVSSANPASYLSGFTSYASSSGVRSPSSATSGIQSIMTGQGVPLSAAMGAKVRLFFESNDADGKTRIYSVDSVDGYVGRDFNLGSATTCSASADYQSTGNCPATVVIGVQGDAINPTSKISAARQNKIAWPTLTDWRWDGAVGTFMVFTIDKITGCTTASHNHGYAVWNGTTFVPQFDSSGCPKAFKSAQAALPMHIGDVRYKLYFGDPSITTGKTTGSTLPFVGPKKLIYADGRSSGQTGIVDYEDWESVGNARNLVFLWPNGDQLSDTSEGYIDDFHFLTPTGSIDIQVLYMSITDGSVAPFSATAVLLNP